MGNTFKYTILSLVREKNVLIWALAFPLIMATLFSVSFGNFDESFKFKPIPTAVVEDGNYHDADAFAQMVDALAGPGEDQMLDVHHTENVDEAKQLLAQGDVTGYFQVDQDGDPGLFVAAATASDDTATINQTILKNILDNFVRTRASVGTIAEKNPAALADPSLLEGLYTQAHYTQEVSVTANSSSSSIRYFYALLGFASLMAAVIGMIAVTRTQANLSPLGARRAVGGTSRVKTLVATLAASWLLSFASLIVAFCYMRYVLGINFGRDLESVFGLAVASLMTTAFGALIGAIPKIGEGAKSGIQVGVTSFFSLFAGLYGIASLRLADSLTRVAPLVQEVNPAKQVTDLFYSLYFYDGYDQFFQAVLTLLAIAAVLFVLTALLIRRQRYASL